MLPKKSQKVEISLDGGENYLYVSKVTDVTDSYIGIELPIEQETGDSMPVSIGTIIKLLYISNYTGQYTFDSKVMGIENENEYASMVLLSIPENIESEQRRDFLRIDVDLEMAYKMSRDLNNEWNVVKVSNVGGGGLQFEVPFNNNISLDAEITGWIVIPYKNETIEHVKFHGTIVREIRKESRNLVLISAKFTDIQEVMRAKIIRYCYERQVALRQKGLVD